MSLFDPIATPTDANAMATLQALLKRLGAKVTRATVRESLLQHPDFPSLLSLSETLTDWHIDNTGLQLNTTEQLRELPLPFIAHFRKNNGWYVLVTALKGDTVTYAESGANRTTESLTDFEKKWSGIVLLAETDEQSGEPDYAIHRRQEILEQLRGPFVLMGALLLLLFAILSVARNLNVTDWFLPLTKAMGLTLSSLLVARQLGGTNVLTDRLCRINSTTNCDGVLNSPAAKLWGWLSWADLGLLYFAGGLLTVFLAGMAPELRSLLCGLSLLALSYTVFSVYYQARIVRQWCTLCLGVQAVLLAEGIAVLMQLSPLPNLWQPYLLTAVAFLLPTVAWVAVKPLLTTTAKSRHEHDELMGFKRNPDLFRALLLQQPPMPPLPTDLHPIVLGNPEAEHIITMVTNPYCGPCARTHNELEQLVRQNQNVNVQIVFWACDGINGDVHRVARHLLALHRIQPTVDYLADWYDDKQKEVDKWEKIKPVSYDLAEFNLIVERHCTWCEIAGVDHTPMLFVNGFLLPNLYRGISMRWLINYLPTANSMMDLAKSP